MPVIFSNGSTEMVGKSINYSASLSPYKSCFAKIVSVHETRKFKPDTVVYWYLAEQVGKKVSDEMGEIWLVSSNPFDIVGARAVGMKAAWVDREGKGWLDALVPEAEGGPTVIVKGLGEAIEAAMARNTGTTSYLPNGAVQFQMLILVLEQFNRPSKDIN